MHATRSKKALAWLAAAAVPAAAASAAQIAYPETRRVDHVDTYHGVEVPDPYRWLEADVREAPEVADWVARQNELTFGHLEDLPQRPRIRERLTELWNYERFGEAPLRAGDRYFYLRNDGLQNQSVLYVLDDLEAEPRALIDPNPWSGDGTVALAQYVASGDGRWLAYGVAESGSDWRTWRVIDVTDGRVLDDTLKWVKFSGVTWTPDAKGFFYGRFEPPAEGDTYQDLNLGMRLYYHRVGTPQAEDVLVYERPDEPSWGYATDISSDGRYLVITVWKSSADRYRILVRDLAEPYGMPMDLVSNFDHEYTYVGSDGSRLFFLTNHGAARRRLIAIDAQHPQSEHWQEVVPETEHTLVDASLVGNLFVAEYLADAKSLARVYSMDGEHVRDVDLPGIGTAEGFEGSRGHSETFYIFSSFTTPPAVYRYDLVRGGSRVFRAATVDFEPGDYEVSQVFCTSKDGTRVPIFLAHRKGLELNGENPTILYGYGGFNAAETPEFSPSRLAWMEMGGVFALANLRGGGEYGEAWYQAGSNTRKQNVFDDFVAAAEWLIDNRYTSPPRLAIQGRSNGGLLVGAVMTQRPELFGAALPKVGVMDMLRFNKFTAGRFWVDDYGSPEDPEEFKVLHSYSPYHNIRAGVSYPATLVTTSDTDDRVVPGHSFKFTAALQRAQSGEAPTLIRIETRAGHGGSSGSTPTSKLIELVADEWAFLAQHLGM